MLALLATAGVLLWLTIGILIIVAVLLETEFEGWATTLVSIVIAGWLYVHWGTIFGYLAENPLTVFGFIGGYLAAGIVWSFLKWNSYIGRKFRILNEIKGEFGDFYVSDKDNLKKVANEAKRKGLHNSYSSFESMDELVKEIKPKAAKKKSIIVSWIAYWPVSLVATLLNDPIRKLCNYIYESISGIYDKITSSHEKKFLAKNS